MKCLVCGGAMRLEVHGLFDDRYGHPEEFSVSRCVACGFMSTEPRLAASDLPDLYARYYPRRRATAEGVRQSVAADDIAAPGALSAARRRGTWSAHYEVRPGMRVLDYGCGECASLLEIKALGAEPYGLEVDPTVRELADALGVRVHVGTLATLPEPEGSFDAVTLSQVIEHVTDPEDLLRGLHAKLKPGGMLVLTTPNSRSLTRALLGKRWLHWHMPFHQNHFTPKSLRHLLERTGFDIDRMETYTPVPWWEYQAELLLRAPVRGHAHPYFEKGASALRESRLGRRLLAPAGVGVVGTIARLISRFGRGESQLVVAHKRSA
jgi:2-polyprenyl-3-methyl-5-hydroxy-6-metoxy-1,4-benzoquinol methylase